MALIKVNLLLMGKYVLSYNQDVVVDSHTDI